MKIKNTITALKLVIDDKNCLNKNKLPDWAKSNLMGIIEDIQK